MLTIAKVSFENYQAKRLQLQEQQAPIQRLVDYGRRWLGWFTAGVEMVAGYADGLQLGFVVGVGACPQLLRADPNESALVGFVR